MNYGAEYGSLLEELAKEADAIAMRFFRADEIRIDRKDDGTAVTQADRGVEEMARAKVAASGLAMDVLGEEMGGEDAKAPATMGRARLIIDPIDGTEEFSRGIATFGTLLGIERDGEIVAGMASAPALGVRWWAYRGEGAWRNGKTNSRFECGKLEWRDGVHGRDRPEQESGEDREDAASSWTRRGMDARSADFGNTC